MRYIVPIIRSSGSRMLSRCVVLQAYCGVDGTQVCQSWAKCCSGVMCTPGLSLQFFQQRFGLLEVGGVKALGEPSVDRG
jgi:hypothetical protein